MQDSSTVSPINDCCEIDHTFFWRFLFVYGGILDCLHFIKERFYNGRYFTVRTLGQLPLKSLYSRIADYKFMNEMFLV
jgi:hypothetical protein